MVNSILAFDNEDSDLGVFFTECSEDLVSHFNHVNANLSTLDSSKLNSIIVEATLEDLNTFIFLVYSHGSEIELLANGIVPFVNAENANNFSNSFFYTCSCHAGKSLANTLIDKGCLSFIGYNNTFGVWDFNRPPFIECANFGIKLFLKGIASADIVLRMKEKYSEHIDNYNNDIFGSVILLSNRRALMHVGDNITIDDLDYQKL
jgi:hypothetical protein